MGAATSRRQTTMSSQFRPDDEPRHAESPTASLLAELQLYGHRPFQDEPDARPLPEERTVRTALADIFDALVSTLTDTRLEPDLEDLLWSTVNLFHRAADRIERELDSNEQAQKRSQKEQDGSEIRSVELEPLLAEGTTLIERRNAFEVMRDQVVERFDTHIGSAWRPRAGLTSAKEAARKRRTSVPSYRGRGARGGRAVNGGEKFQPALTRAGVQL
jgi:hypothetical protein